MDSSFESDEATRLGAASHGVPETRHPPTSGLTSISTVGEANDTAAILDGQEESNNTEGPQQRSASQVEGPNALTDALSLPPRTPAQSQSRPNDVHQHLLSGASSGHHTRSQTKRAEAATNQQQQLSAAQPRAAISSYAKRNQVSSTGPTVKRRPGRPRKYPLQVPQHKTTHEPSQEPTATSARNSTLRLGQAELSQMIANLEREEGVKEGQHGQAPQPRPGSAADSTQTPMQGPQAASHFPPVPPTQLPRVTSTAPNIQATGRWPPISSGQLPLSATFLGAAQSRPRFSPAVPTQSPPIAPARARGPREPEEVCHDSQSNRVEALRHASDTIRQRRAAATNPGGVTSARRAAYRNRIYLDIAAIYYAHNPAASRHSPWPPQNHHQTPTLHISPPASEYPWTLNRPLTSGGVPPPQPHFPPYNYPPLPHYAYWSRDLNARPTLPTISISNGPAMPCFELTVDGGRVDMGFGPGVRVVEAFRWLWVREERRFRQAVVSGLARRGNS